MNNANSLQYSRLGALLVKKNLITPLQLRLAIVDQNARPDTPLGQVLVQHRVITQRQLSRALRWQTSARAATFAVAFTMMPFHAAAAATFKISTPEVLLSQWTSVSQTTTDSRESPNAANNKPSLTAKKDNDADFGLWDIRTNYQGVSGGYPTFHFGSGVTPEASKLDRLIGIFKENSQRFPLQNNINYHIDVKREGASLKLKWDY